MAEMHPARQLIVKFLALGLLAAHLAVVGMAMSPSFHHWLHGDSDDADHQCAVTNAIDGQLDRPEVIPVGPPRPFVTVAPLPQIARSALVPTPELGTPDGRAPPRWS